MRTFIRVGGLVVLMVTLGGAAHAAGAETAERWGWWDALVERVEAVLGLGYGNDLTAVVDADGGEGAGTNSSGCFDPFGKPRPCP